MVPNSAEPRDGAVTMRFRRSTIPAFPLAGHNEGGL